MPSKLLPVLAAAAIALVPGQLAHAQSGPDPCAAWAAQLAMPSLQQSYAFTPSGYGPYGYGPLMQPFGNGIYGQAALFGPPGLSPTFGPLGPGLTANQVTQAVLVPGGVRLTDPMNSGTLISLASLQQAELGNLNMRYNNSGMFQMAAGTWSGAYATQGQLAFMLFQALCQNQPGRSSGGS